MGDVLVILMMVIGLLVGIKRRVIRMLMGSLIVAASFLVTTALYDKPGYFLNSFDVLGYATSYNLGFVLTAILVLFILELLFRWAFKDTSLPRLFIVDNVLGAFAGMFWGLMLAGLLMAPFEKLYSSGLLSSLTLIVVQPIARGVLFFFPGDPIMRTLVG